MEPKLYTAQEAATFLQLHVKTVRRKIRDGNLESTKVGKQYRISQVQLEAFCGHTLSLSRAASAGRPRRVYASTVVTVDAVSPEENLRMTNSLIAVLNSNTNGTRVDCIYHEDIGQQRIIINGDVGITRELLLLVQGLLASGVSDPVQGPGS